MNFPATNPGEQDQIYVEAHIDRVIYPQFQHALATFGQERAIQSVMCDLRTFFNDSYWNAIQRTQLLNFAIDYFADVAAKYLNGEKLNNVPIRLQNAIGRAIEDCYENEEEGGEGEEEEEEDDGLGEIDSSIDFDADEVEPAEDEGVFGLRQETVRAIAEDSGIPVSRIISKDTGRRFSDY